MPVEATAFGADLAAYRVRWQRGHTRHLLRDIHGQFHQLAVRCRPTRRTQCNGRDQDTRAKGDTLFLVHANSP